MTYDPTTATYTQTQEVGFLERIGGSLLGIPLGIILIFFPISLLWWNEHRNVDAEKAIELALQKVISVPATPLQPQNNGSLVHVIGTATASAVNDSALGLTLPGVVVAMRRVEMYQWRERQSQKTNTNWGGSQTTTTTYSYDRSWSSEWQDSRSFRVAQGHSNPPMPALSALLAADDAKLGAFRLSPGVLGGLTQSGLLRGGDGSDEFGIDVASLARSGNAAATAPGFQVIRAEKAPPGYNFDGAGGLYQGKSPSSPAIGDVRVSYTGVPSGKMITVVARQHGDGFIDFPVARGFSILLAAVGEHSAEALLEDKATREATLTWMIRIGGLIVMWLAFMLLLGPLATLVSIVPFLGTLAEGLTADIAFFLALILTMVTIGIAWLFVHPLFSLALIVGSLTLGGGYIYLRRG